MDQTHILIIEDDLSICELLFSLLHKEGYRVLSLSTGEEGLQHIEETPPDLVILDLNLPGMNGLDVCRTMRRDPWMSSIPVLMLTGNVEDEDVLTGLEVGADDYVTKPFSPKLLQARVKALLRRTNHDAVNLFGQADPQASSGPPLLKIKTLGYCDLRIEERHLPWAVAFSNTQRQLLAMLISAPNSRVPQEEIQAAFWPDSNAKRARSSFDSLLLRVRNSLEDGLAPFDSKQYLVLKHGILCLENCRIDSKEFARLIQKGLQHYFMQNFWQSEMTLSSALGLWQGTFLPADFGIDAAILYQDELEQLYLEGCQRLARILAKDERYPEAVKVLRYALRYNATDDKIYRLLYQLALVQDLPGQARQVIQQYRAVLERENFSQEEIEEILDGMPQKPPEKGWIDSK